MNERTIKKQEEAAGLEIGKQEYAHLYDMKGEKTLFCVNYVDCTKRKVLSMTVK